ncbi:MAG TPA: sialate O-acetylesterase [Opitutaceae bacterium]|nr:sialate O-acetylesterase [Opitutaceae bacterium]
MLSARFLVPAAACAAFSYSTTMAAVRPNPLFSDHAVLQQGREVPVWGTADDGERVVVEIAGRRAETTAAGGRWLVRLPELPSGGPYTLTIRGTNTITLQDVLVGEVWICSGQSNMERQLGPRAGQQPIIGWERETAAAHMPRLRQFQVAQKTSPVPLAEAAGEWKPCSPETAPDFSAVGFFFGRALQQARAGVPVGLIHSAWGGTPAEAWTSLEAMRQFPGQQATLALLAEVARDPARGAALYEKTLNDWFGAHDVGSRTEAPWSADRVQPEGWTTSQEPGLWEAKDLPGFDGIVWFRKEIELPAAATAGEAQLSLGPIDDVDTVWLNGTRLGSTGYYQTPRHYRIPAGVLRTGRNVIAVRVLDSGGGGGFWGQPADLVLRPAAGAPVPLAGAWERKVSVSFRDSGFPPANPATGSGVPTVLFNGMIAPLQPYAIRGALWYQGEANNGQPQEYRRLLPATIADWRRGWGQGDFPFLFVQIAPFHEMTPELREAQLQIWHETKNTAMVVTTDCGDADDIHPTDKRPVGERLALAARAMAYGEALEYSGPVFTAANLDGAKAVVRFSHVGGGLVAPGGALRGFELAGADGVFHPAEARIVGDTVEIASTAVATPKAVRYGWANVPDCNLFNAAGLPASPFRAVVADRVRQDG